MAWSEEPACRMEAGHAGRQRRSWVPSRARRCDRGVVDDDRSVHGRTTTRRSSLRPPSPSSRPPPAPTWTSTPRRAERARPLRATRGAAGAVPARVRLADVPARRGHHPHHGTPTPPSTTTPSTSGPTDPATAGTAPRDAESAPDGTTTTTEVNNLLILGDFERGYVIADLGRRSLMGSSLGRR